MRRDLAVCALLFVVTLAVYGQVMRHDFVNFDDDRYVYGNPQVRQGLTWGGVLWALTSLTESNWHPLTWLSHMLDCELFGLDAGAHHLVSVLIHTLNGMLLYLVFARMTGAVWRSGMVAALFALHPLHVESVAWVSERKDVLSTLFFMLTLWAYVRYTERPSWSRYGPVFGFLALSLMAKPMLVTLPFVLLLLDYWPLARFPSKEEAGSGVTRGTPRRWERDPRRAVGRLVVEKVPLFVLVTASCVVTFVAQQRGGAMAFAYSIPFSDRVANALVSYVAYVGKMLWPSHLAVFYPYRHALPAWEWAGAALALAGFSIFAFWAGRRWRYLTVGWFWYVGTLVPVIGLVQVGKQSMADRYTYLPLIGLFLMGVWALADLAVRWRYARVGLATLAGAGVLGCMVVTFAQGSHWRSGEALFAHTLRVTKSNALAHTNLGNALLRGQGKVEEAIAHYREALRINPQFLLAHNNLGVTQMALGRLDESRKHFEEVLRLNPMNPVAHNSLGVLLARQGKRVEAIAHYEEALRMDPGYAEAYSNLGVALMAQGDPGEALRQCREATRIDPYNAKAHNNLGVVLAEQGKDEEAIARYREAVRIDPGYGKAHVNLGFVLARQGKRGEAMAHYREALRIDPEDSDAHRYLAEALVAEGNLDESMAHYQEAIRLEPEDATLRNRLGGVLAGRGAMDEAILHFREALRLNPDCAEAHGSLAMALADRGEPEEAIVHYCEAIRLKPDDPVPYNNLAWIRANHPDAGLRDSVEAIRLAERACALSGNKDPRFLDTLATAYAEAGRFPEAVATLKEALSFAASTGAEGMVLDLEKRLESYEGESPYREVQVPPRQDQP